MARVVFIRAANVGGHQVFKPAALAKDLADLDVVNIGAVGTFVVRGKATAACVRERILERVPFDLDILVRPGNEVRALVEDAPFGKVHAPAKAHVSVLARKPRSVPKLPLDKPDGRPWDVRLLEVRGAYALSLQCGTAGARLYPNAVVEKVLGVPATTRGWATFEVIAKALDGPPTARRGGGARG